MRIHENIKRLRVDMRLSQEELSERLGVSRQAVSKWETGDTAPDISILPMLASVFGVTIDALFGNASVRRYGGYGSHRNELLAMYEAENDSEEDFARAAQAFSEVILSGKATTEDYVSYGLLHHIRAKRDYDIAMRYYRQAIEKGETQRDTYWMLAHTQLLNLMAWRGKTSDALEEGRKWVEKEPECCGAHAHLAHILKRLGRLEEAYDEVKRAVELDPEDMNALTCAGDICGCMKKYDEAIAYWDRAYEMDSSCISCWFSKAEAYAEMGEGEKAIAQFEKILAWLEERGYDMQLESVHPLRRIAQIREQMA